MAPLAANLVDPDAAGTPAPVALADGLNGKQPGLVLAVRCDRIFEIEKEAVGFAGQTAHDLALVGCGHREFAANPRRTSTIHAKIIPRPDQACYNARSASSGRNSAWCMPSSPVSPCSQEKWTK